MAKAFWILQILLIIVDDIILKIDAASKDGAYCYGFILEGARWDINQKKCLVFYL